MTESWAPEAWRAVADELDRWADAGRAAGLWWRDDDAGRPDPGLTRLLALARRTGLPLGLAVVPAWLAPETADEIGAAPAGVRVLQHGVAHVNHEPPRPGSRPAELGSARAAAAVVAELTAARTQLEARAGERALRVLVPPWNRIATEVSAQLHAAGYRGLSTFGPRGAPAVPGLQQVNSHLDLILWREAKRFAGAAAMLGRLRAELGARRSEVDGLSDPIGLLTHHRDLSDAGWTFTEMLLGHLAAHRTVRFPSLATLFSVEAQDERPPA